MEFCNVDKFEDLIEIIQHPQNQIIAYLMSLREKKLSWNSISTRLNAIYHFYDMNDVTLNKKKIKMFKGEYTRKVVDKAYTHEDIKKIIDISDLRAKTIVLLMASSGLRIGALPSLKIRNMEKIDNLYKITVYEGSNSQYITFTSPECSAYIDAYLDFRAINGENLSRDSYLIREQFDISDLEQIASTSKGMTISGINSFLNILLFKSGVRTIKHTKGRREVARAHGFRKFFTTQCVNAKMNPEIREMLLGHKIGLASCYYRPTEQEMLNEFMKAVPLLTISNEERLKFKLEQRVQIEKSQIEKLKQDFETFKNQMLKQRTKK